MTLKHFTQHLKHTPFRILLPSVLMFFLFAGSVFLYLLPSIQQALLQSKMETIQELSGSIIKTLEYLNGQAEDGKMTMKQAQTQARNLIRSLRHGPDNEDYYWINDTTPVMIMHPHRPDLEGKNMSDYRDKEGKALFSTFVSVVQKQGSGFVDYYWQWRDHPEQITHKISYVHLFKPWGRVIGTGVYHIDIAEQINGYRNKIIVIFLVILVLFAGLEFYIIKQASQTEKKKRKIQHKREQLINALKEGEERYRTIADFAYDWEIWIDRNGQFRYCSPSCERISGHPPEAFFEDPDLLQRLVLPDDRPVWDEFITEGVTDHGDSIDFRITTSDNRERWINAVGRSVSGIGMKPLGFRCSFRDITERKRMEEQLRHQALHDPLTGLANRTLCADRIGQAMRRSIRRENYYFSVIFLDLDRFKIINDSLGHRFGDMVLSEVGRRLSKHIRTLDTVARFGGDEFVLLLDELSSPGEAIRIVKRIRLELAQPYEFHGHEVQTTASFGIVLSPVNDVKAADILQYANIAMHRAKEAGRNRFKVFTGRMLETAVDQLNMENDMRRGLDQGEFHLQYQPIMDIDGSDLVGFEALARWDHPTRGEIPPSEFIPIAEETGIILTLGEWVLQTALATLSQWRKETEGAKDIYMSVNLSSKQFARMELDRVVMNALKDANLPPEALKLEITESAIMAHPEAAVRILHKLRKEGVRFSIDDFGTGYSSLSQLQQLPVDTLKVDRTFISRMKADSEDMEIVKAVIACLAHSLELDVVAEGVEAPDQLCSLLDLDCECVQGFYFHEPLAPSDAERLLKRREAAGSSSPQQTMSQILEDCRDRLRAGKKEQH